MLTGLQTCQDCLNQDLHAVIKAKCAALMNHDMMYAELKNQTDNAESSLFTNKSS